MRINRLLLKVRNEKEDLKQTFLAEQRQEFWSGKYWNSYNH
jgi:hypothetical protein